MQPSQKPRSVEADAKVTVHIFIAPDGQPAHLVTVDGTLSTEQALRLALEAIRQHISSKFW